MSTPAQIGIRPLLSNKIAMADPITSWISDPMIAISVIAQSAKRAGLG